MSKCLWARRWTLRCPESVRGFSPLQLGARSPAQCSPSPRSAQERAVSTTVRPGIESEPTALLFSPFESEVRPLVWLPALLFLIIWQSFTWDYSTGNDFSNWGRGGGDVKTTRQLNKWREDVPHVSRMTSVNLHCSPAGRLKVIALASAVGVSAGLITLTVAIMIRWRILQCHTN